MDFEVCLGSLFKRRRHPLFNLSCLTDSITFACLNLIKPWNVPHAIGFSTTELLALNFMSRTQESLSSEGSFMESIFVRGPWTVKWCTSVPQLQSNSPGDPLHSNGLNWLEPAFLSDPKSSSPLYSIFSLSWPALFLLTSISSWENGYLKTTCYLRAFSGFLGMINFHFHSVSKFSLVLGTWLEESGCF